MERLGEGVIERMENQRMSESAFLAICHHSPFPIRHSQLFQLSTCNL